MYTTSTLSLNRHVTLPPGLYKARQGPFSLRLRIVVWTSLGPLPRWVPGPTTRWAPGTTRLVLHGT
jgi:hypothetical protein